MTDDLRAELERASAPKDQRNVVELINSLEAELVRSLGTEEAAAILTRHYLNAVRYNVMLRACTPESLVAALLLSAQVRLEPGPLGHVYLVPFKEGKSGVHNVVWMLGYTGIVELARRGGTTGLRATVVWDVDEYEPPWENEKGVHWLLRPGPVGERAERVAGLVAWKEGSERVALHMPPERVDVAIKASRNPKAAELRQEDWYWRKTAVRFARPWLPLSTDAGPFAQATAADGGAVRTVDVSDGEAVPVVEAGDDG